MSAKNLFIKKMKMILLLTIANLGNTVEAKTSEPKCLSEVFLRETYNYNPKRGETRHRLPAQRWKNNIIYQKLGHEIYSEINPEEYQLMLHAVYADIGLEVYRICQKGTIYPSYGRIQKANIDGYRVSIDNLLDMDSYLYYKSFTLSPIRREQVLRYLKNQRRKQEKIREKENIQFEKDYPFTDTVIKTLAAVFVMSLYVIIYILFPLSIMKCLFGY